MAKKTYVAASQIRGIEAPKVDKASGNMVEHVLEMGAEISLDEALAAAFVAGGSLVLKGAAGADLV